MALVHAQFVAIVSGAIGRAFRAPAAAARRRWRAGVRALALLALAGAAAAQGHEVRDDSGQRTRFDAPPRRVVSLLPSLTETVCALGACDRLVGVDRYSNWPPEVRQRPQVGGGLDPNIEAIVALRPDVVLLATSARAAPRLRALGLRVVALEPRTRAELSSVVQRVAQVLQVDGADALLGRIDAGVAAAAQSLPPAARGARVYFEVSPAPYAAGRASFIGETLQALGLDNIVGAQEGAFPKINPEWVVRAAPDLIMAGEQSATEMPRRPGWARLRAISEGRVCVFSADERDILVRPGPRMAEAAQLMADCARRTHPAAAPARARGARP